MKTKHTKGEWMVTNNIPNGMEEFEDHTEVATEEWSICAVFNDIHSRSEAEANAKLIAAAPDMLEALNDLINAVGNNTGLTAPMANAVRKAQLVIKKATE